MFRKLLADAPRQSLAANASRYVYRLRSDSLLRNSLYIMATTAATALIGFVYWLVAARMYPASAIGLASALISVMALASTLANLGIGPALDPDSANARYRAFVVTKASTRGSHWP